MSYARTYRQAVVRLHQALTSPMSGPPVIAHAEFEDCDIYGPSVIGVLNDVAMQNCSFDAPPEALFIEATPDRLYVGIIGVHNARFVECRFHNVGILASPEVLEVFRQELRDGPRQA